MKKICKTDADIMNQFSALITRGYSLNGITKNNFTEWVKEAAEWVLEQVKVNCPDYRIRLLTKEELKANAKASAQSVWVRKDLGWIR